MSKMVAFETLNELMRTLELKKKYQSKRIEKILTKNYILSLYTIWETYAKKRIFDTYSDYEYLLHTDDFIKRYLKKSFGKSYLSKEFLKDIKDTKVKKEILCQSNNLTWGEFIDLLAIIGIDSSPLETLINESAEISNIVNILKSSGLIPVYKDGFSTLLSDSVKGYLQLVVDLRNTISHTYKMEFDEHIDSKQMMLLVHLFKCTINIIEIHINNEISKKYLDSFTNESVISVTNVIRGCNASGNQEAILEIIVTNQAIDPHIQKLVISSDTNKGYCTITGIRVGNFNLKKLPLNKVCTVTIVSNIKVRRGYQYGLCLGPHKSSNIPNIIHVS
ncbi:hypothetical protein BK121_27795 [Paenibacillus odorifer]|uniref:hypothetical protein n=1 Tax=Paenibacillus odorifer TaxID=189426 RepID=UPI00096D661D|nr:hypothetical protein [Paenibacillus odorifer]OMC63329.1 hypothetical protein BK121_27795 [Paenibacillus odorifer]